MASSESARPTAPANTRNDGFEQATVEPHKKRSRIRFSCTTCREKKQKCNRQLPCDQCTKRGVASTCKFIPYVSGTLPRSARATIHGAAQSRRGELAPAATESSAGGLDPTALTRLKHLEHLVHVLKAQRQRSGGAPAPSAASDDREGDDEGFPQLLPEKTGLMVDDLRYVDASNWEAVLSDTISIARHLTTLTFEEESDGDGGNDLSPIPDCPAPDLLLGGFTFASVQELRRLLPPRHIADRLLVRYFDAREAGWIIFHTPTFMKRYNQVWEEPCRASYTLLAVVFIVLSCSTAYHMKGGEEMPGGVGDASTLYKVFKSRAAKCLALGDYTKPGPYKVEALLLYFSAEYFLRGEAAMGGSMILSIAVRLAMHMGMHRDPKHHPTMTPFEGEMRRRIWAYLRGADVLISFQLGLPSSIHPTLCDTAPPRNIHDEEFDEDTEVLPPSRPETERTRALWHIVKSRLVAAFSDVAFATNSRRTMSYAEICRLEKRADEAYRSIPACLRHRPFGQSVADPVDLITQRYQLELVYQKMRMVLHRSYIGYPRSDKRYDHSRRACLDAATQTLRHQYELHREHQTGGRFATDRSYWFFTSFTTHNFLLADMIVCLELWSLKARETSRDSTSLEIVPKEQLVDMLRSSRLIWESRRRESAEANRVFKILTKMISLSTGETFDSGSLEGNGSSPSSRADTDHGPGTCAQDPILSSGAPNPASADAPLGSVRPDEVYAELNYCDFQTISGMSTSSSMDGVLNTGSTGDWMSPGSGDWTQWDSYVLNGTSDGLGEIPWDSFFQPACPGI